MLQRLRSDMIDAIRELKAGLPTVTAAVMTLAAAVGMNLAMFSVVDRALISPPQHIAQPDRLFSFAFHVPGEPEGQAGMTTTSFVTYRMLRDDIPALSEVAAWQLGSTSVVIDGEQMRADTVLVSGNYFQVLGAPARAGRGFSTTDETAGVAVAVVSDAFWRAAFGTDPGIIGRRLMSGGIEYTVIGVMPRGFSGHSAASVDVWLPLATAMRNEPGWDQNPFRNVVSVFGRLAESSTVAVASAQATAALERRVVLRNLAGQTVGASERRIAIWLSGVALLVLVLGLSNAATLLLVGGAKRRRESAIRAALGASHGRLLAQVAIQAVFIAVAATTVAVWVGYWLDEAIRRVLLPGLAESSGMHGMTLAVASAVALASAAVAFGAGASSLPSDARTADLQLAYRFVRPRVQNILLFIQTVVCVLLLAGTGMFARSLYRLIQQNFGMRMDDVLVVEFEQGGGPVADRGTIFSAAIAGVRALPGVQSATTFQTLPFGAHHIPPISVPGRTEPPNIGGQLPYLIAATPEFFDILGIKLLQGRRFTSEDNRGEPVVIVNETMARTVWPGENAIGKCIRIGFDPSFDPSDASGSPTPSAAVPCRHVIGVASDVRQRSVVPIDNEAGLMQYYVPPSQTPGPPAGMGTVPQASGLLVRTAGDPARLIDPIRRLIVRGRGTLPYLEVRPYVQSLERQVRPWRLGVTLLGMFSALAMGIAAIGLYAAFAHAVTQRTRELAIRVAIGASPSAVVSMILGEAGRLAASGIVAGAAGAVVGGRSLQAVLFGFVPADPVVLAAAALTMLIVVVSATLFPAVRASRVDPNTILRAE